MPISSFAFDSGGKTSRSFFFTSSMTRILDFLGERRPLNTTISSRRPEVKNREKAPTVKEMAYTAKRSLYRK
ncbi:unnamed protein product [Nezara viridula]|uniref:Uncharacterized protein n=1 Tax=Nezara viridula TaxID=85310 RepID=A0A9P0GWQ0_NEZVI|nr:unnamed protein product [Nezara viridula]